MSKASDNLQGFVVSCLTVFPFRIYLCSAYEWMYFGCEHGAQHPCWPFIIVSATEAKLNGATDEATPSQFRQMIEAYPGIKQISMIDCPGTENDDANLEVAR
ncbi:MAG: hypothetical protein HC846_08195 [Blastocatellia bacterium]|nr:hypothetical protein [Blastocatellia bacterium]